MASTCHINGTAGIFPCRVHCLYGMLGFIAHPAAGEQPQTHPLLLHNGFEPILHLQQGRQLTSVMCTSVQRHASVLVRCPAIAHLCLQTHAMPHQLPSVMPTRSSPQLHSMHPAQRLPGLGVYHQRGERSGNDQLQIAHPTTACEVLAHLVALRRASCAPLTDATRRCTHPPPPCNCLSWPQPLRGSAHAVHLQ